VVLSRLLQHNDLMPKGGFEPPLSYENCALNAARLPVPPLRHQLRPAIAERSQYIGPIKGIKKKLGAPIDISHGRRFAADSQFVTSARQIPGSCPSRSNKPISSLKGFPGLGIVLRQITV
jgi:hypothetical protein